MLDFRKYINETPLGTFSTSEISNRERDNKITAPLFKTDVAGKLKQILDKTRWNFNIVFMKGDADPQVNLENPNKSISIVFKNSFYGNASAKNISDYKGLFGMTPWMLLHRIGHEVFDHHHGDYLSQAINKIFYYGILQYFAFKTAGNTVKHGDFRQDTDDPPNANVLSRDEFKNELVAEYLWHGGHIRLINNPPASLVESVKKIEVMIAEVLDEMEGRVFYA